MSKIENASRPQLQQIPTSPAPEVIVPTDKPSPIVYQPLKLVKIMTTNHHEGKEYVNLKETIGLSCIAPDTRFRDSIFRNLLYDDENTKVEFLIVVAMYNEDVKNFTDTMHGIADNLDDFRLAGIPSEKILTVIIVDGMRPFLQTYNKQKPFFSQFFDENAVKDFFKVENLLDCKIPNETDDDEFAHCFMKTHFFGDCQLGCQTILCVKQKNKRKLNTHLWFFGGFCEMIQPKYVMLLDIGTKPLPKSLFYLYEAMRTDERIAGCCGEITVMEPNFWNMVQMAQLVEYKISHMFDKALESIIGYITVLPGAFSAYRWEALQGEPLWDDYFKSICHPYLMNAFQSNIYLAEDRVLCLALVSKKECNYLLRYVKKSVAETDVPEKLSVLMSQRRRWINGSWFALIDSLRRADVIYYSNHSCCRKFWFTFQMFYYAVSVSFTWFMVGTFFLAFAIAMRGLFSGDTAWVGSWLIVLYITVIIIVIFLSLGVKPARVEEVYKIVSYAYGIFMIFTTILMFLYIFKGLSDINWIIPFMIATVAIFTFVSLINRAALTVAKGAVQFILMTPTYVNVFLTYAICNIHDCSWGNRPDQMTAEEKNRVEEFEEFRTKWAMVWALCNSAFAYYLNLLDKTSQDGGHTSRRWFIYGIAFIGVGILFLRFIGAMIYWTQEECCKNSLALDKTIARTPRKRDTERRTRLEMRRKANQSETEIPIHEKPNDNSPINGRAMETMSSPSDMVSDENGNSLTHTVTTLKAQREEKGVSIEELAKMCEISPEEINMIESGEKIPTHRELKHIKKALRKLPGSQTLQLT